MGAFGRGLYARLAAQRNGRETDRCALVSAGANSPGREEKVELNLPEGLRLTRVSDKSLSELLAANEIDCAIIARPPNCFLQGHPDIIRLFPNYLEMEEEYY